MDSQKVNQKTYTEITKKPPIYSIIVIIVVFSIILWAAYSTKSNDKAQNNALMQNPDDVILKVGEEAIYKKDLDYELSAAPVPLQDDPETISNLTNKLINDSIALQQGHSENIIELGSLSYNNKSKDYSLRLREVAKVKNEIDSRTERIEGVIISIWYYNSIIPKIGIQAAREIVKTKIEKIHSDVKSNKISTDQAIQIIKADTSLAEIDGAYISNAGYRFNAMQGDKITIDKEFDNKLWSLKEGELSDVSELQGFNKKTGKSEAVLFSFGKVEKRASTGNTINYEQWLKEASKKYAVTRYQ